MNIAYINGEIHILTKILKEIDYEHKRLVKNLNRNVCVATDCSFEQLQTLSYIRGIVERELSVAEHEREVFFNSTWIDCGIFGLVTDDKTLKDDV